MSRETYRILISKRETHNMTNYAKSFIRGFVKGILAPIDAVACVNDISDKKVENPFKELKLGSVESDKQKIRRDFDCAIQKLFNEKRLEVKVSTKNKIT